MYATDNEGSWRQLGEFVESFPDDHEYWSRWKPMAREVLASLEKHATTPLFRAGQSMHHIVFSTLDRHGLEAEPRVTLEFHPDRDLVRVAYSDGNLYFCTPQSEISVSPNRAVPVILGYMRRLWIETKPDVPLPAALDGDN